MGNKTFRTTRQMRQQERTRKVNALLIWAITRYLHICIYVLKETFEYKSKGLFETDLSSESIIFFAVQLALKGSAL